MLFIESLRWRYATKRFDTSKKVSQQHINYIKEAVQLSASSFGLQPYKILEIKTPELREALKSVSRNQTPITDASTLFLFCNTLKVNEEDVENLMQLKSEINGIGIDKIKGYGDFVKGKLKQKSEEEMFHWTAKQTYIALSNAMNACAELRIDCIPIEGFESDAYNEKLGLIQEGLNACVVLAIGYRHKEDNAQNYKKVRKSMDAIFYEI